MSIVSDRKKGKRIYNELLRDYINIDRANVEMGK